VNLLVTFPRLGIVPGLRAALAAHSTHVAEALDAAAWDDPVRSHDAWLRAVQSLSAAAVWLGRAHTAGLDDATRGDLDEACAALADLRAATSSACRRAAERCPPPDAATTPF
jgi:hypothetical protein